MVIKSKYEPYFIEMYLARKKYITYRKIAAALNEKYNINIHQSQVSKLLATREKRGIKPTEKDIINYLKKDNGSKKTVDIFSNNKIIEEPEEDDFFKRMARKGTAEPESKLKNMTEKEQEEYFKKHGI